MDEFDAVLGLEERLRDEGLKQGAEGSQQVYETAVRDGQVSGFGVAAELGFYRGRAEARVRHDGRKGKLAKELLELLDAYDVDNFEEETLTNIRSRAKMLVGHSKRRNSGAAVNVEGQQRATVPLDVVNDRAAIEDW